MRHTPATFICDDSVPLVRVTQQVADDGETITVVRIGGDYPHTVNLQFHTATGDEGRALADELAAAIVAANEVATKP